MNNKILLQNLRCIKDFPVKGINFRDVTTLFKSHECLEIMLDELYEIYKDKGITKIVGIESRGFVAASQANCPLKPCRRAIARSMVPTRLRSTKMPLMRMMSFYSTTISSPPVEP